MKSSRPNPFPILAALPAACLSLFVAAGTARADLVVGYDNPLIPFGLGPGDSFHLVFATSTTTNRDAGAGEDTHAIGHWNAFVDAAAAASAVPAIQPSLAAIQWSAMVSTVSVAARDNALVSAPVYRLDGERVATGFADVWDGSIEIGIQLTENLTTVPGAQAELVWSGSTSDGQVHPTYPLGNGTESALTGRASATGGGWIAGGGHERRGPGTSLRIYALSERLTVEVPPDTDGDGLPDWYEQEHSGTATGLDPDDDLLDQDGLTNLEEYQVAPPLDPTEPDTDADGLLDGVSITLTSGDPRYAAWAAAGIAYSDNAGQRTFRGELTMGTGQNIADTDGDGLPDGPESNTGTWVGPADTGTDPLSPDSDADGLKDGVETNSGVLLGAADTGTHPLLSDTDGDEAGDWYEIVASFTSPFLAAEKPNVIYPLPDPDSLDTGVTDQPVRVYIMAGQSNTVGIGYLNSFGEPGALSTITRQENKFPNLVDAGGAWTERNDVLYKGVVTAVGSGPLTAGQGADSSKIGPELGFGHVMGWHHVEPVLVLKASQGNRSLGWDFLPPGSLRYTLGGTTYAGYGDSPSSWPEGTTPTPINWYAGKQFDECFLDEAEWAPAGAAFAAVTNAADVLADFDTLYPQWATQGYEIAGFVWWQGHKDGGQSGTGTAGVYAERYEDNLVELIESLRATFNAPDAPFVVATVGFNAGAWDPGSSAHTIWTAQMAVGDPVQHPDFAGNVASVDTTGYWREVAESPGSQGFHYNNNAETYMLVGDAAGRAMLGLLDDVAPPDPDPMTFAIAPSAFDSTTVGMVATVASDRSGPVEYLFENTSNSDTSGWITSPDWFNTGLAAGSYGYRVKARDAEGNETEWSATVNGSPGEDLTAPTPDPMGFADAPVALGADSVTMTAATAADISGVEYFFDCTTAGGNDSGWQDSPAYTDTGLSPGIEYSYRVQARDKSAGQNATGFSASAAATIPVPDVTPPTPNPATFADAPAADGDSAISMTATTGSDDSGPVEYLFTETSGNPGGTSSGWQTSPSYTDTGLDAETGYTYTVTMQDSLGNTGTASAGESATTDPAADGYTIAADSPLVPAGVGPGDSFHLAFVTSSKTTRDAGGGSDDYAISHWDSYVNGVADGSALPDVADINWFAMVSVDDLSDGSPGIAARDHAVVSEAVYRTDGALVADGFDDLWDGAIAVPIVINESGDMINTSGGSGSGRFAWTGSTNAGDIHPTYPLGNGTESGTTGDSTLTGGGWFQGGGHLRRGPTNALRLYAISEVVTVAGTAGNTFAEWIGLYPGVGGETGFGDDPDRDGKASGLENFLGTDPSVTDAGGLRAAALAGDTFTFRHPQNAAPATDVSAAYRWTKDLVSFFGDGASDGATTVTFSAATDTPVSGTTTVTAIIAGPVPEQLFVDVEVTQDAP